MQMREKVGKSRNTAKSKLAKAAGTEPAGQMRDEKLHAVVARSTFPTQNAQNAPSTDHFWQLRCRKSARHCGAKHISKSKCIRHTMVGVLLEVKMSKKCTPLWREPHFQVLVRTTFGGRDIEKVHAVLAQNTCRNQNALGGFETLFEIQISHRFGSLHYTIHSTTLHYITLHSTTLQLQLHNYTPLHSTRLHYTPLNYT